MEAEDGNEFQDNYGELNLSNQGLKKISKDLFKNPEITSLILDGNSFQRIENLDHLTQLICLSAVNNKLVRMYGVSRLTNLTRLNLSKNGIVTIEGLRNLTNLHWLSLAGNNIKQLESIHTNVALEFIDVSENLLKGVSDLSPLKNLQVLKMHDNQLTTLKFGSCHLPNSLKVLTLANNLIADLNEISYLSNLTSLESITIANNPCVSMTGKSIGFDHRPFLINWCMSLRTIDDYMVGAKESLKAEWLYSQGRGRQFHVGEQAALVEYLASVCPLSDEKLSSQDEQKLMLILSKAQQHQRQLWEETSGSVAPTRVSSPPRKPKSASSSPALSQHSRLRNSSPRQRSPASWERHNFSGTNSPLMSSSYTVELPVTLYAPTNDIMTASADAVILNTNNKESLMSRSLDPNMFGDSGEAVRPNQLCESNSPLKAASKLVPVPETIMSPDYRPATARHLPGSPLHQKPKVNGAKMNELKTSSSTKSVPATLNSANHSPGASRLSRPTANSKSSKASEIPSAQKLPHKKTTYSSKTESTRTAPFKLGPKAKREQQRIDSSDEDSEMSISKLETIQNLASARKHKENARCTALKENQIDAKAKQNKAATTIQKIWRGYRVRNLCSKVKSVKKEIQASRQDDHVRMLSKELNSAKAALQVERRLRLLQMEAIKSLWKEVQGLQSPRTPQTPMRNFSVKPNESSAVADLTKTCAQLQEQVQQLQTSLESVVQCMTTLCAANTSGFVHVEESMSVLQCHSLPPQISQAPQNPPSPIPSIPVQVIKSASPEPAEEAEEKPSPKPDQHLLDIRHAKSKQRPSYLPIFNSTSAPLEPLSVEPVKQFAGSFVESLINTAVLKAKLSLNKRLEASSNPE
ncbi:centrosomal protein of 97 kDa isoform X2 [Neocloeon triangulifer]|uniref:centrosomal protein of 97 kDa isoform X2 n=1 Tax=Neocloeon triangulifer TaxID=2078957 RepID=UPI00286F97E6|nr:centrosomal protein of 97 kDa isoform X2 [Neocloeon triangulifer]